RKDLVPSSGAFPRLGERFAPGASPRRAYCAQGDCHEPASFFRLASLVCYFSAPPPAPGLWVRALLPPLAGAGASPCASVDPCHLLSSVRSATGSKPTGKLMAQIYANRPAGAAAGDRYNVLAM